MSLHLAFCYEWGSITTRLLFFRDKLRKQIASKSAEFGLSQLNCSSTTTDGLTAMTLSPSTLPWAIIILPPHLTFSPGSHPSCFSPSVSPQSTPSFTSRVHEAIFGPCYLSSVSDKPINIIIEPPNWWNWPHDVSRAQLVIFSYCHCKGFLSAETLRVHYLTGTFYGL